MLPVTLTLAAWLSALCLHAATRLLRAPLRASTAMAFCVAVCVETVLFNLLSLGRLVTRAGTLGVHVSVLVAWTFLVLRRRPRERLDAAWRRARSAIAALRRSPVAWVLVPLVAALTFVAVKHAPNNYDSLTYHLARVADWMQLRSVAFYPTHNPRQNDTGPGAEYLVLLLQVLTESDVLANTVQLAAYVALTVTLGAVFRGLGAPRTIGRALTLGFACTPPFLLQATSTQNDLCAAATALAALVSVRRFLPAPDVRPRWDWREGAAIGVATSAGYLVKPTVVAYLAPILLLAGARALRACLRRRTSLRAARLPVAALGVLVVTCAPHLARKHAHGGIFGTTERANSFELTRDWGNARRLRNPLYAIAHHLPSAPLDRALKRSYDAAAAKSPPDPALTARGIDGFYAGAHPTRFYEDLIGAPLQFSAIALASVLALLLDLGRRRLRHMVTLSLCPLLGWVAFHLVGRNNQWLGRYHLPWFALAVLSTTAVLAFARQNRVARAGLLAFSVPFAVVSVAYGWAVVSGNELRPLSRSFLFEDRGSRDDYYTQVPALRAEHDRVLALAETRGCHEVATLLAYDDIEYPLVWRARQRGIEVHAAVSGLQSACLVYNPHATSLPGWHAVRGAPLLER